MMTRTGKCTPACFLAILMAVAVGLLITFAPGVLWAAIPAKGITVGGQAHYYIAGDKVTHGLEVQAGYLGDFKGWLSGPVIYLGHGDDLGKDSAYVAYGFGLETILLLDPTNFTVVVEGRIMHTPIVQEFQGYWGWSAGGGFGWKLGGLCAKLVYQYGKPFNPIDPGPPPKDGLVAGFIYIF